LVKQLEEYSIDEIEKLYPKHQLLFIFDNSTGHAAFAKDALVVSKMNLEDGGAQPIMRDGWFEKDDIRVVDPMFYMKEVEIATYRTEEQKKLERSERRKQSKQTKKAREEALSQRQPQSQSQDQSNSSAVDTLRKRAKTQAQRQEEVEQALQ
jgi:hypothetical protein